MNNRLPIACTLTPDQLARDRDDLLPGLLASAVGRESVAEGFRWRFEPQPGLLERIGSVLEAEHRCCAFLEFRLEVGAGEEPIYLQVSGPPGTSDFLLGLLA